MPAANHTFYLRHCYLENDLAEGRMEIGGIKLDLQAVTIPIYNLATREDHIAPPRSVFVGSSFFGGPVTFVLAGSGHIAGVINPPAKEQVPVLDRTAAGGRSLRGLARERRRASRLVVAALAGLDRSKGPSATSRRRPRAQRRS